MPHKIITIVSTEERLKHPQIKMIPESIWNNCFTCSIAENLIALMQVSEADLQRMLAEFFPPEVSPSEEMQSQMLLAIAYGHPHITDDSLHQLAMQIFSDAHKNQRIAIMAASLGKIELLKKVLNQRDIQALAGELFYCAAKHGHHGILEYLKSRAPREAFTEAVLYKAFYEAAKGGYLNVFHCFESLFPNSEILNFVKKEDYESFRAAARSGKLAILEFLIQKLPGEASLMVKAKRSGALKMAIEQHHFAVVKFLINLISSSDVIIVITQETLRYAVMSPELDLLKYLIDYLQKHDQNQFKKEVKPHLLFPAAVMSGRLATLQYIQSLVTPNQFLELISHGNYEIVRFAAKCHNTEILAYLVRQVPPQQIPHMMPSNYSAFVEAAKNNNLNALKFFAQQFPEYLQAMVASRKYEAFSLAAQHGHVAILRYLGTIAPTQLQDMIKLDNYGPICYAAHAGHLEVIEYLEENAQDLQEMMRTSGYNAFTNAIGFPVITGNLLAYAHVFRQVESNYEKHRHLLHVYTDELLMYIRSQKQIFSTTYPHTIFNITEPEQVRILFYVVRNLIRRNDPREYDAMQLLLDIPAVRAISHTAVTPEQSNELLRLALSLGNQGAVEMLMTIPTVKALAEHHQHYRAERKNEALLHQDNNDKVTSRIAMGFFSRRTEPFALAPKACQPLVP